MKNQKALIGIALSGISFLSSCTKVRHQAESKPDYKLSSLTNTDLKSTNGYSLSPTLGVDLKSIKGLVIGNLKRAHSTSNSTPTLEDPNTDQAIKLTTSSTEDPSLYALLEDQSVQKIALFRKTNSSTDDLEPIIQKIFHLEKHIVFGLKTPIKLNSQNYCGIVIARKQDNQLYCLHEKTISDWNSQTNPVQTDLSGDLIFIHLAQYGFEGEDDKLLLKVSMKNTTPTQQHHPTPPGASLRGFIVNTEGDVLMKLYINDSPQLKVSKNDSTTGKSELLDILSEVDLQDTCFVSRFPDSKSTEFYYNTVTQAADVATSKVYKLQRSHFKTPIDQITLKHPTVSCKAVAQNSKAIYILASDTEVHEIVYQENTPSTEIRTLATNTAAEKITQIVVTEDQIYVLLQNQKEENAIISYPIKNGTIVLSKKTLLNYGKYQINAIQLTRARNTGIVFEGTKNDDPTQALVSLSLESNQSPIEKVLSDQFQEINDFTTMD